ncbi:hypothetical protein Tco_1492035 [Tanacetum coccineum]
MDNEGNKNINVVNKKKRLLQLLQHALNDDKPDAYYYDMEVEEQKQWKLESEQDARLDAARKQKEEHWKELEAIRKLEEEYEEDPELEE